MKFDRPLILFIAAGLAAGFGISSSSGMTGLTMSWEVLEGGFLGLIIGFARSTRQYGILAGVGIGFLIALLQDWLNDGSLVPWGKSSVMFTCGFIGWGFRPFLRQVLAGGLLGGVSGFILGLVRSQGPDGWVLTPGVLSEAAWSYVDLCLVGMALGSLYMKAFGWKRMEREPDL
jgi:hypothetical protein